MKSAWGDSPDLHSYQLDGYHVTVNKYYVPGKKSLRKKPQRQATLGTTSEAIISKGEMFLDWCTVYTQTHTDKNDKTTKPKHTKHCF